MKRTVQMHRAGIPSARSGKLKVQGARGRGKHVWPVSLGDTPIVVRSLVSIGGARPSCKWRKKMDNKARRAGFTGAHEMLRSIAKASGAA